ncbi:MAG: hypothetical protein B0D92_03185 [Spirochaeta sp. LUC14_002_19_P3]|nr:MAG: hypothetical protein B0D92_03185 [Spirochaeta sp. LUC14_002_19_P3]
MKPKDIDTYLGSIPDSQRTALQELRAQIRKAAPKADECISYGIPVFRQGGVICGFGAAKKHLAFYPFSSRIIEIFAEDLKNFDTSKGTIRFQPENPLPSALISKIVKARLEENNTKT